MKLFSYTILVFLFVTMNVYGQKEPPISKFDTFNDFLVYQNNNINQLKVDMTINEVVKIMGGSITVKIPKVENNNAFKRVIRQPSSREIIRRTGKKPLIVYWYFMKPVKRDGIIQKDECIPLIVEKKKILGIGMDDFEKFKN